MAAAEAALQNKVKTELEIYQGLQKELNKCLALRQKLEAQRAENTIVKEELDLLEESNTVYKLIGPVLVKQDLTEAKSTVGKRLEYITAEIKRYDTQMRELERRCLQERETLGKLQQDFQKTQSKAATRT